MPMTFSAETVARCQALVAEIDAQAQATGAYETESEWIAPGGNPVHSTQLRPNDVTADFLADLPQRSHFFTGWPPDGATLSPIGAAAWAVLRLFSPELGVRVLARWWHRFQREPRYYGGPPLDGARTIADWYSRRLPTELRPTVDFDGTELDRLALCERLTAMHRLGIFNRLHAAECPVVLEIGAGYGMLAAAIRRAVPRSAYVIVDLPHSLALSGCYLTSRQKGAITVAGGRNPLPGTGNLVLNTQLALIEGQPINLAINTLSFAEMSESVVEIYAAFLRRNLAPEGVLFEQNYDNSHFERANFCDPSLILTRHFKERARDTSWHLRGTPRLWATS